MFMLPKMLIHVVIRVTHVAVCTRAAPTPSESFTPYPLRLENFLGSRPISWFEREHPTHHRKESLETVKNNQDEVHLNSFFYSAIPCKRKTV